MRNIIRVSPGSSTTADWPSSVTGALVTGVQVPPASASVPSSAQFVTAVGQDTTIPRVRTPMFRLGRPSGTSVQVNTIGPLLDPDTSNPVVVSSKCPSNVALNAFVPGGAANTGWNIIPFQYIALVTPSVPKIGCKAFGAVS